MARLLVVSVRDVIVCEALAGPCGGPVRVLRPVLYPGMLTQATNIAMGSFRTIS